MSSLISEMEYPRLSRIPQVVVYDDDAAPFITAPEDRASPQTLKKRPSKLAAFIKKACVAMKSTGDVSQQPVNDTEVDSIQAGYPTNEDAVLSSSLEDLVRAINHAQGIVEEDEDDDVVQYKSEIVKPTVKAVQQAEKADDESVYYRCDIFPQNGVDFAAAETECKQLVREVGGRIVDDYEYIGGFLYTLPAYIDIAMPLNDRDPTQHGGHISVTTWTPFTKPCFDGLRMSPPMSFAEGPPSSSLQKDRAPATPTKRPPLSPDKALPNLPAAPNNPAKRRMQHWVLRQRKKADDLRSQASICTLRDLRGELVPSATSEDDEDLALGPRILDPGVELAILDPRLIRSSLTQAQMAMWQPRLRASWVEVEKEVELPEDAVELDAWEDVLSNDGSGKSSSAGRYSGVEATAVGVDLAKHVRVREFGEEMRRMESMYRNWVPEMSQRRRSR